MKPSPYVFAGLSIKEEHQTVRPMADRELMRDMRRKYNFFLEVKEALIEKSVTLKLSPSEHAEMKFRIICLTASIKEIDARISYIGTGKLCKTNLPRVMPLNYARFEIRKLREEFQTILSEKSKKYRETITRMQQRINRLYRTSHQYRIRKEELTIFLSLNQQQHG